MTSTRGTLESVIAQLQEVIDQLPADSPEVPDRIGQWPYEDEHLRRDFWKEPNGNVWRWVPSEEAWQVWLHEYREWAGRTSSLAWMSCTFTRTMDPSQVPDRVEVWPEDDEHLRGDCWKSSWDSPISYQDGKWRWWNSRNRTWHLEATPGLWTPLERVADPSQPRRFDSISDIPEDVKRSVGKYMGYPCELARSSLSGTGWMMRVDHPYVRQQWVEYMDLGEDELTDIEEVIDHE